MNGGVGCWSHSWKGEQEGTRRPQQGGKWKSTIKTKGLEPGGQTRCFLSVQVSSGKHSTEWTHCDIFSGLTFERRPPQPPFGAHVDIYSLSHSVLTPILTRSPPGFCDIGVVTNILPRWDSRFLDLGTAEHLGASLTWTTHNTKRLTDTQAKKDTC